MQLPAARIPLLSHNLAGGPNEPHSVREPERRNDDGSRLASETHRAQRLRLLAQAPGVESNKLPTMCVRIGLSGVACVVLLGVTAPTRLLRWFDEAIGCCMPLSSLWTHDASVNYWVPTATVDSGR